MAGNARTLDTQGQLSGLRPCFATKVCCLPGHPAGSWESLLHFTAILTEGPCDKFPCIHISAYLLWAGSATSPLSCPVSSCFTIRLRPSSIYPDAVKKHKCDTPKGRDMIYFPCLLGLARLLELALPPQPYQKSDRSLSFLPTPSLLITPLPSSCDFHWLCIPADP